MPPYLRTRAARIPQHAARIRRHNHPRHIVLARTGRSVAFGAEAHARALSRKRIFAYILGAERRSVSGADADRHRAQCRQSGCFGGIPHQGRHRDAPRQNRIPAADRRVAERYLLCRPDRGIAAADSPSAGRRGCDCRGRGGCPDHCRHRSRPSGAIPQQSARRLRCRAGPRRGRAPDRRELQGRYRQGFRPRTGRSQGRRAYGRARRKAALGEPALQLHRADDDLRMLRCSGASVRSVAQTRGQPPRLRL